MQPPGIAEHFTQLGWPLNYVLWLGLLELACTIIYLVPRTAVLGAILLTGYQGAASATHVRIDEGGVAVFPIGLGVALWAGLYLRDPRLRALIPLTPGVQREGLERLVWVQLHPFQKGYMAIWSNPRRRIEIAVPEQ